MYCAAMRLALSFSDVSVLELPCTAETVGSQIERTSLVYASACVALSWWEVGRSHGGG